MGMMNKSTLLSFLIILTLPACMMAKNQRLLEAIPLKIAGFYEGEANIDGETMKISIFDVKTESLSTYRNVGPLTGGNRIALYFDTDRKEMEAEYCAFIYSDEITFRKGDGLGLYPGEIAVFKYLRKAGNVYFDIPLKYFTYKPFAAWTETN